MFAEATATIPSPVAAVAAPVETVLVTTQGATRTDRDVHKQLRFSIAISAARCMLTYVVVPLLSPLLQPTVGHNPRVVIPLSVTALVFDGRAVRGVWRSELRWRWRIVAAYALLMAGIAALITIDIWHLATA
jgi:hypothetical protein